MKKEKQRKQTIYEYSILLHCYQLHLILKLTLSLWELLSFPQKEEIMQSYFFPNSLLHAFYIWTPCSFLSFCNDVVATD